MGVRTGQEYIEGLPDGRQLYVKGEKIDDVTQYPPFQGVIQEMARLYDRQHESPYHEALTYPSPTSGEPVSTSFVLAKAWGAISTQFGGRQALYERFFAGDPINNRILHYGTDRRKDCQALARRLPDADRQA